jgi:hypothetical protein
VVQDVSEPDYLGSPMLHFRRSSSRSRGRAASQESTLTAPKPTLAHNVMSCLSRPAFVFGCMGYAAYTGVVAGLGFYGPLFLQYYRPCDHRWDISQGWADAIFGSVIASSGLVGTMLGGAMLDRIKANHQGRKNRNDLARQLIGQVAVGLALSMVGITRLDPPIFFIVLFLGSTAVFMVSAGINILLMWTVPKSSRPMSSALTTLFIHMFGDVPSPVLIGWLSDTRSPLFTLATCVMSLLLVILFWLVVLIMPLEPVPVGSEEDYQDSSDEEVQDLADLPLPTDFAALGAHAPLLQQPVQPPPPREGEAERRAPASAFHD